MCHQSWLWEREKERKRERERNGRSVFFLFWKFEFIRIKCLRWVQNSWTDARTRAPPFEKKNMQRLQYVCILYSHYENIGHICRSIKTIPRPQTFYRAGTAHLVSNFLDLPLHDLRLIPLWVVSKLSPKMNYNRNT